MRNTFKAILITALSSLLFSCNSTEPAKKSTEKNTEIKEQKHMLIAYVAGYRDFDFNTIDVSELTHINYAE